MWFGTISNPWMHVIEPERLHYIRSAPVRALMYVCLYLFKVQTQAYEWEVQGKRVRSIYSQQFHDPAFSFAEYVYYTHTDAQEVHEDSMDCVLPHSLTIA